LLALFDQVLDSWSFAPARGLPIGALTSQYLGNFYLDAFDSQMQASGLCGKYVRYMDDIVIWGSQMQLSQIRSLALHCSAELKLEIKHGGEWNRCHQGLPFLGFIVYPDRIRLGRQARRRFRRKFRHLRRFARTGQISEAELQARLTSLFAHVETGDDLAWRKAVLRATDDHFCG
jgi:hypothetical protein